MRIFRLLVLAGALGATAAAACGPPSPVVKARSKANLADLIGDQDYPAQARAAREQGLVQLSLEVGPNGRVTGCTVTRSSGSALLDSTTCRLMRSRARFTPAVDSSGAPVPDKVAARISWSLPAAEADPAP